MVTVGISHYCEKVRWTLDSLRTTESGKYQLDYYESAHVPGLAACYTTLLDEGTSATPIVRIEEEGEGRVLKDSTVIMDELSPPGFWGERQEEGREYEEMLDSQLGSGVRCFAYYHLLGRGNDGVLAGLGGDQTSLIEQKVFGVMAERGMIQPGMKKFMGITEGGMEESRRVVRGVFEDVGERVKGGGYIMGDTFTRADLTFASLASPLLNLTQFKNSRNMYDQFPKELRDFSEELRR